MWRRTARRTLLLAWLLGLGLVAYVATHPRLIAPFAARLASQHFFRQSEGRLRLRDFAGNPLYGVELHDVSLSLALPGGGVVAASVDTLVLDYRLGELLGDEPRLRRLEARGATVHATTGPAREAGGPGAGAEPLRLPRLRVDAFAVAGAAELADADGRLRERIAGFTLRGEAAAGGDSLRVRLHDARVDWASRGGRLEELRGSLRMGGGALAAEDVHCLLNGRPVEGRVARTAVGDLDITVQARDAYAPEVGRILDENLDVELRGDIVAHVRTQGDSLRIDAALDGTLEGYEVEGLRGWALSAGGELTWTRLRGRINGALFDGSGRFSLGDPAGVEFWLTGDVADVDLSRRLGLVDATYARRLTSLIERAGLPTRGPALGADRYLELMRIDKKAEGGEIRFVVIEAPGRAAVQAAPDAIVREVIGANTA